MAGDTHTHSRAHTHHDTAQEWNADGRYSSSADGMEPLALPVVSHQPMPVAAYFLSAVYSRVHAAGKKGKPRGPAGGAQKMWANAAIVLLRQAMDEGWRKLVGAEVESAAEIWAHLWNVYELRHISADSVNLGAVPAELL